MITALPASHRQRRLLRFENVDVTGNETGVDIQRDAADIGFVNVNIQDNSHRGVSLVTTSQSLGTSNIVFEKSSFHNNSRGSANNQDGIRIDNWDESAAIRSVTFKTANSTTISRRDAAVRADGGSAAGSTGRRGIQLHVLRQRDG